MKPAARRTLLGTLSRSFPAQSALDGPTLSRHWRQHMYGVVLMAALNLGTATPGFGNEWCFRSTPHNWYKGGFLPPGGYEGWWYSATAWNGCPPVCVPYIKPGCPIPCCCGG